MTDDIIALSRRAIACKGWRWMGGMRTANEERVISVMRDGVLHLCAPLDAALESVSFTRVFFDSSGSCLPDLSDPATLGCLLALVRAAWNHPHICVERMDNERWCVDIRVYRCATYGASEAEALVAALEAAP
jgi:hypothetical protein